MPIFSAGSASVNIVPDFSGAQRAIGRWAAGMRDVKMKVDLDVDKGALTRTKAEIAAHHPTMHVNLDIDKKKVLEAVDFITGFSTIGKGLAGMFSPKVLGITDLVGAGTAVVAAVSQIGPAAALLPALFTAAAAPIATMVIGAQGIGTAFKALASGDAAKVSAAMKDLAPSARDFVTQIHALGPAWTALRLDVQQKLFDGLGQQINKTATVFLPVLRTGLSNLAGDLNGMASQFLDVVASTQGLAATRDTFANIHEMFANLSGAVQPFTQAFLTLMQVGSKFLPAFGTGIAKAAEAFNSWIQKANATGQLASLIQTALARIKQVFDLIVSVGRVLGAILKPAISAGVELITIFTNLFNGIAKILNSTAGQNALKTFFDSIATAVKTLLPAVLDVVGALVKDFLPIAGKLAAALAPLIGSILKQFADLLHVIAPLIYPTLVNAAVALLSALAPLIPIFAEIAKAILPVLTKILAQLAPIIGEVAAQLGQFLAKALVTLAPLLAQLGQAFVSILKAILPIIPPILNLIQSLLPPLIKLFQAIIPVIVTVIQAIAPLIAQIVSALTPALKVLADIIAWAFQTIIGPVITFVVKSIIVPMIQAAIAIFKAMGDGIKAAYDTLIKPTWDAIATAAGWLWHTILEPAFKGMKLAWDVLSAGIKAVYDNGIKPVWDTLSKAIGVVKDGFQTAITAIGNIWHGLIRALESPVQIAIDWVWNKTLRNAWNLLNDIWGGKNLDPIVLPGFSGASGGILPGYTPGKDVHHFYSPTGGMLHLSGGEAIMVPEFVDAVGEEQIYAWNRWARNRGPGNRRAFGFADGGVWPSPDFGGHIGLGNRALDWATGLASKFSWLLPFLPGGDLLAPIGKWVLAEAGASGDRGSAPISSVVGSTLRNALNSMWDWAKGAIANAFSSTAATHPKPMVGSTAPPGAAADAVRAAAATFGWSSGAEWDALAWIINHESGFNPNAQNPTSSAYGLFQFLDGTWASVGGSKTSDPALQSLYGMRYISSRYHDPLGAQAFWMANGYYDRGGWLPPGYSMSYNGTGRPERILDAAQSDRLSYVLSGASGGSTGGAATALMGDVHLHGVTGDSAHEVMDELWHRLRVARRGGVYTTSTMGV